MDDVASLSAFFLTKDRQEYLKQNVAWHSKMNLNCRLYVLDASKTSLENWAENNANVTYMHMPEASFFERFRKIESVLRTDFFVICADDDFLLPNALDEITKYLIENKHKNIASAQGRYLLFDSDVLYPKKVLKHTYSAFDKLKVEGSSPLRRMLAANSHPIFHYCYSVCKKDVIANFNAITKNIEEGVGAERIDHTLFEPIMGLAVAISGEYVGLNNAYCVRRPSVAHNISPVEDVFSAENFSIFQEVLIRNISMLVNLNNNQKYNEGYVRAILDNYCIAAEKRLMVRAKKRSCDNSEAFSSLLGLFCQRIHEKIMELANLFCISRSYFDFDKEVYNTAKGDILELSNFLRKTNRN